ncbi:MAG: BF3164 family lipoprotein, partial [Gemmatimonas sp.]|uniref:BF3164 family lipoprotein n=1 Tax=Gemmatimonas sp. TaxID=1962908 RepID=UPI00391EEA70
FDDGGRAIGLAERFFSFEPRFEAGALSVRSRDDKTTMALGNEARIGYVSLALSKNFIYALFSGTTMGASMTPTYGAYLYVFDFAGKSRGVYKFQGPVAAIAVEPDDSRLYATRHDPEPALLVYRLPALRKPEHVAQTHLLYTRRLASRCNERRRPERTAGRAHRAASLAQCPGRVGQTTAHPRDVRSGHRCR